MKNSTNYENLFKSFLNGELFKTETFFANLEKAQKDFTEQAEGFYKIAEENNKKFKAYIDEQMKVFNSEAFTEQVEKFTKVSEENAKAVQQFLEKNFLLDKDALMEQLAKLMKLVEENNEKALKVFQEYISNPTAWAAKK